MISVRFVSALAAAAMVSLATAQSKSVQQFPTPTVTLPAKAIKDVGCFSTGVPLDNHGPYDFQSQGNCQLICIMLGKPVMALSNGSDCSCGDLLPPKDTLAADDKCTTICEGSKTLLCGGADYYWVSLTGTTNNPIKNYEPKESSSSKTQGAPQTSSTGANSAISTPTNGATENKSSGPNKAGIAAGVVVGVVVIAAIVAGVILFLRHKRRREVEEEYRRQAAVTSFAGGGKLHTSNSSMTDSRLDPEFVNRRQSNGSIADNEDYSRRILKVTNA